MFAVAAFSTCPGRGQQGCRNPWIAVRRVKSAVRGALVNGAVSGVFFLSGIE